MRLYALYATSIICGFCMMALEMLGGRFLQPTFGTGIDVWSAIISVFILSLSVGYVIGGRIADKSVSNLPLGIIIVISGCFYLILPAYATPFAEMMGGSGGTLQDQALTVLFTALALFFAPSLLLGCISPMLVKLVFTTAAKVGRTTGTLYAIGSFGNVLGVLISTYVMLTNATLNSNMLGMGVILCLTGLAHIFIRTEAKKKLNVDGVDTSAETIEADAV
ncbi:MAG: fused MFS/spermidine synthase [Planctomycetes bacterium]|nr:fused MFS/spermidine synthase [Planctomycetota bacterium]